MEVTAGTMQVAHTLKVVTQAEVASVVCQGYFHHLIHRCINILSQTEARRHLQVVRRPQILRHHL